MSTLPSSETPANRPFVLLYANMPLTLFKLAAPAASAFLPTGPAAIDTLPPNVMEPACAKVLTALVSLRMNTKSVSSKPICPPKPPPTVPIALGADHEPSLRRATTTPEPKRPLPRKPALKTVITARPYNPYVSPAVIGEAEKCMGTFARARISGGMILSGPNAWLGSMKEARILPAFLHSPVEVVSIACASDCNIRRTFHAARQRIID